MGKVKDFEGAFVGKAPSVVTAPELWKDTRDNLMLQFPSQSFDILNLFNAYNVQ
jgi:hypothetical protein